MGPQILKRFYSCTIESITAWYVNYSASDRKRHYTKLPAIQDLYSRRCQRKALKVVKDSSHPSNRMCSLSPHGKQYRSIKSRSKRNLNSFYPQDIRLLYI